MFRIVYEKLQTRSVPHPFLFANEFECDIIILRKAKRRLSFPEKSRRDGFSRLRITKLEYLSCEYDKNCRFSGSVATLFF